MKKLFASILCVALAMSAAPVSLIAAAKAARGVQAGQISGQATVDGKPLGKTVVRLRNVDTKQLAGETVADNAGNFSFTGLTPGNYVVETIGANGSILGTSTVIALTAGALVATGVLVGTSAAALGAAGGVAAAGAAIAGAAGAGGVGFLGLTTAAALAVAGTTVAVVAAAVVVTGS